MSKHNDRPTTKTGKPMDFPISNISLRMAIAVLPEATLRELRPKLSREAVCQIYPLSPHFVEGLERYYEMEIATRALPGKQISTEDLWLIFEPRIQMMIDRAFEDRSEDKTWS